MYIVGNCEIALQIDEEVDPSFGENYFVKTILLWDKRSCKYSQNYVLLNVTTCIKISVKPIVGI